MGLENYLHINSWSHYIRTEYKKNSRTTAWHKFEQHKGKGWHCSVFFLLSTNTIKRTKPRMFYSVCWCFLLLYPVNDTPGPFTSTKDIHLYKRLQRYIHFIFSDLSAGKFEVSLPQFIYTYYPHCYDIKLAENWQSIP